jgi:hypothetical protein
VETLLLCAVGAAAGLLGALMGVGGGVIVVPALSQLLGLPFRHAVAVSLLTIVASSSATAAAYVGRRLVDLRVGVVLELATVSGAILGSAAAALVPVLALKLLFATVSAYAAAALWLRREGAGGGQYAGEYQVRRWGAGLSVAGLAGALSGLLGIGGGVFKVPAMSLLMGLPFKVAAATSNFTIGVTAAASAYLYFARGDLDALLAAPVVVGVFLGARLGSHLLPRLPAARLQGAFALFLLLVGARTAWDALARVG